MVQLIFYGTSGWFENEMGCTSCVGAFPSDTDVVLFDLGTGVRKIARDSIHGKHLTVILTHLHLDHSYGLHLLPLFKPASLTIFVHEDLKTHLETLFNAPFTKPYRDLGFPVEFKPVRNGVTHGSSFSIATYELKHNTPVIGARLTAKNTSIAYSVDSTLCDRLFDLTGDADIAIVETAPPPGKSTNGYHLTLAQLQEVLSRCRATRVIVTHFGALKYPDDAAKKNMLEILKSSHSHITMAYDGFRIEI